MYKSPASMAWPNLHPGSGYKNHEAKVFKHRAEGKLILIAISMRRNYLGIGGGAT